MTDGALPSSWIGSSGPDHITLAGMDLPSEVMGRLTLTELAFLLVTRREPTPGERRLTDAVLVSLADHGLTPSALATRLTHTGAPESPQGAIAAGLLGAGSVFLGPAGDTAHFLAEALAGEPSDDPSDHELAVLASELVTHCRRAGRRLPGLGHPVHRDEDPRTPRIYALARDEGLLGPHLRLLRFLADAQTAASGRHLPVNGAGAGGAALVDMGIRPEVVRAFVLIARTAGLVGHLAEELDHPLGPALWHGAEGRPTP